MRRRDFIALAGAAGAATVLPRIARAQATKGKVPRIVLLAVTMPPNVRDAILQGLADHGFMNGTTMALTEVTAASYADLTPLVAPAVASNPDLIVTWGITAAQVAAKLTSRIPIVFASTAGDPVQSGLVESWAHPGGNVTGTTSFTPDLVGKHMGLLREAFPQARRVALMSVPGIAVVADNVKHAAALAAQISLDPVVVNFNQDQDAALQFGRLLVVRPDAVYVPSSSYTQLYTDAIFDFLLQNRLPALCGFMNEAGTPFAGVIGYSPDLDKVRRRAGSYVDAILHDGAKPADLSIEQPTVFEFGVNLDMARKIGVTIPISILVQATLVIDYDIRAPR